MIELYIHPGYGKTATTFLQNIVFKNLDTFTILGKPLDKDHVLIKSQRNLFQPKYASNPLGQTQAQERKKEYMKNLISSIRNDKNKKFILSDEVLFDKINYFGDFNFQIIKEIVTELKKELDISVKFLVSIRKQDDLLISNYSYTYNRFSSKYGNFESFINTIFDDKNDKTLEIFNFYSLYKDIKINFDCDILLLPIEKLVEDKENYLKEIERFTDAKIIGSKELNFKINVNSIEEDGKKVFQLREVKNLTAYNFFVNIHQKLKTYSIYKKNYERFSFLKSFYSFLRSQIKLKKNLKQIYLSDKHRDKILDYYANSNKDLEKISKCDLKRYKYFI